MKKMLLNRIKPKVGFRAAVWRAFTLVELMVSMGVFIVFLGVVSTSYINVVRSQRQANETRRAISEARDFMQTLADDFRSGTIDYDCYGSEKPMLCPISTFNSRGKYLALIDKNHNMKTVYWFDSEKKSLKLRKFERIIGAENTFKPSQGFDETDKSDRSEAGWRVLFSDNLKVADAIFDVYPPIDPYLRSNYQENQYQFQPGVRLLLTFSMARSGSSSYNFTLQTSFSSRMYGRRSGSGS